MRATRRSRSSGGGGAVAVALSTTPDYDHRVPLIAHRGPTHTLLFALVVGAVLAAVAAVAATEEAPVEAPILATFAFTVGTLSIGSHLLADWLTPMGIHPSGRSRAGGTRFR